MNLVVLPTILAFTGPLTVQPLAQPALSVQPAAQIQLVQNTYNPQQTIDTKTLQPSQNTIQVTVPANQLQGF